MYSNWNSSNLNAQASSFRIFPHKPDYTRAGPQIPRLIEHESHIPKRFHQKWFTKEGSVNKHGIAYDHITTIKPYLL